MPKIYIIDQKYAHFYCPACKSPHGLNIAPTPNPWAFNGDINLPTFSPSILVTTHEEGYRCHSFIRNGKIEFCGDSTHELAGKTIEVPEYPEEWMN